MRFNSNQFNHAGVAFAHHPYDGNHTAVFWFGPVFFQHVRAGWSRLGARHPAEIINASGNLAMGIGGHISANKDAEQDST